MPVTLPLALINPPVKILLPVTLPLALTTEPNKLDPVTVPVALIKPPVNTLPPVTLPVAVTWPAVVMLLPITLPDELTTPVTKTPVLATVSITLLATAKVILPELLTAAPTTINVPGFPATEQTLSC